MLSINISELLLTVLNFFILMFVLDRLLYRPVIRFRAQRQSRVEESLRQETLARERQAQAREEAEQQPAPTVRKDKPRQERPRAGRAQQQAKRQLTICQREMDKLEEAIRQKEAEMEAAACDYEKYGALYAEKEAMDEELLALMERWEALCEEVGE